MNLAQSLTTSIALNVPSLPLHLQHLFEHTVQRTDEAYQFCLSILQFLPEESLLIVDNFDALPANVNIPHSAYEDYSQSHIYKEPLIADLLNLPCHLLITTRCNYEELQRTSLTSPYKCFNITKMAQRDLSRLFNSICRMDIPVNIINRIIMAVYDNTLLVKLIAILLRDQAGVCAPEDVLNELEQNNALNAVPFHIDCQIDNQWYSRTFSAHITSILGFYQLSDTQKNILINMALMPDNGIPKGLFSQLMQLQDNSDLNALIHMGFIEVTKSNIISLHSLIRNSILQKKLHNLENCKIPLKSLTDICSKYLVHKDPQTKEVSEVIDSIADRIIDIPIPTRESGDIFLLFLETAIPFKFSNIDISKNDKILELYASFSRWSEDNSDSFFSSLYDILSGSTTLDTFEIKLRRIILSTKAIPDAVTDTTFQAVMLKTFYVYHKAPKGQKKEYVVEYLLKTAPAYQNSKFVKCFLYPFALYLGKKIILEKPSALLSIDSPEQKALIGSGTDQEL